MEAKPTLSIIIAYHNSRETIERTLMSILPQKRIDEVELVFVDDGSTDGTTEVVENLLCRNGIDLPHVLFSKTDDCRGIAHATAIGFRKACGEWLMRVDSDDELAPDAIEQFIDAAKASDADIVWGGITMVEGERQTVAMPRVDASDFLNDVPLNTVQFSLCNKIIRRDLLIDNDILPFKNVNCWEDLGVVSQVLALKPVVTFLQSAPYIYYVTPGLSSLSRSANDVLLRDHLRCADELNHWFEERGLQRTYFEFLKRLKFIAKVKFLRGKNKNIKAWKSTFPEVNRGVLSIRHIPLRYRILFAAVNNLPSIVSQSVADIFARLR